MSIIALLRALKVQSNKNMQLSEILGEAVFESLDLDSTIYSVHLDLTQEDKYNSIHRN